MSLKHMMLLPPPTLTQGPHIIYLALKICPSVHVGKPPANVALPRAHKALQGTRALPAGIRLSPRGDPGHQDAGLAPEYYYYFFFLLSVKNLGSRNSDTAKHKREYGEKEGAQAKERTQAVSWVPFLSAHFLRIWCVFVRQSAERRETARTGAH